MGSPVDILIVGGGIAGLSAAATIVRQDHSVVILDSQIYRNGGSQHMHTLATWDHRDPADWRAAARKDLERYGTVVVENEEAKSITKQSDGSFFVTSASDKSWQAKKIVLATGVVDVFPDIPGYDICWISAIFHCLYCRGWEEKGTDSAGVLAEGECAAVLPALHVARQALQISKTVVIYTDGNTQLAEDIKKTLGDSSVAMEVDARKIEKLEKSSNKSEIILHFRDGKSVTEGFLAHKPRSKLRGNLQEQLGLEIGPKGVILAKPPFNESSVKGVFVAGDCCMPMQTMSSAQASGTNSGAGSTLQLQAEMYNQTPIF